MRWPVRCDFRKTRLTDVLNMHLKREIIVKSYTKIPDCLSRSEEIAQNIPFDGRVGNLKNSLQQQKKKQLCHCIELS